MNPGCSLALLAGSLLGACTFNAPAPASYRCSKEQPACPSGQTCVGNLCVSSALDARPDRPRDEARVDGHAPDQGKPDTRRDGARPDGTTPDGKQPDGLKSDLPQGDLKPDLKGDLKPDLKGDLPKPDLKGDLPKPDTGPCGNGQIDTGEECDNATFPPGTDCFDFNRNGGTLTCVACKIDLSKCCLAGVPPVTVPAVSRIVSSSVGSDATTQPLCTPYQSITKALVGASPNAVIWVMPGSYTAPKETFPILLPAGVTLLGDEANKGMGSGSSAVRTEIAGAGPTPFGAATLVGANLGKVSGFHILGSTTPGNGIHVGGIAFIITKNTFAGYGGVRAEKGSGSGCPGIIDNVFNTSNVGVLVDCTSSTVQGNVVNGTEAGIVVQGGNATIHGNTLAGCAELGIQILAGSPQLNQNQLTGATGAFKTAGIGIGNIGGMVATAPKIRWSTFATTLTGTGVLILSGNPDLGTQSDPGNQKFAATKVVLNANNATVNAFGNTWATSPPSCNPPDGTGQIVVNGTNSKVIWGTAAQTCPP